MTIMLKETERKKVVFIGLSGGVDSAVSAALLKKQGYEVVGVFMRTWHPDFLECNEEEERLDAMRVAAHLDISFLTFDFEKVYKKEVADYMIKEYKTGGTPNPDVMCNKEIKFGAFLKKAISMGADFVATGHYANVCDTSFYFELPEGPTPVIRGRAQRRKIGRGGVDIEKNIILQKGIDPSKDQSYFLWTLKQEQLKKILFPIGHLKKTEVRKLALKFNLPVAEKKDSQGICFLGAVDLKEFLKHYIKQKKGKVILTPPEAGNEKGEEIGYHDGVVFYTLGERHGFIITKKSPKDGPYYIVGKNAKKNTLYVSQNAKQILFRKKGKNYLQKSPDIFLLKNSSRLAPSRSVASLEDSFCLSLKNTNWISKVPKTSKNYTAQIRYHSEFLPCKIKIINKTKAEILFKKPVLVASGQSCVIYDKNICLGGGVVI